MRLPGSVLLALALAVPAQAADLKVLSGNGARAREPQAARAMLRFFTAAEAAPVLKATGIEPFVE